MLTSEEIQNVSVLYAVCTRMAIVVFTVHDYVWIRDTLVFLMELIEANGDCSHTSYIFVYILTFCLNFEAILIAL